MTSIPAEFGKDSPRFLHRVSRWTPRGAIGWGLVAIALPKCPACIAGYLSLLGVGLGMGSVLAGVARPTCIALALVAAALFLRRRVRVSACASRCSGIRTESR